MFSLVNKHEELFDYLVTNAEYFHKGTLMAKEVLQDPSKLERYVKEMKVIEDASVQVTREVTNKIKQVFVTPIDREDFFLLIGTLGDCVDDMKDLLMSLRIYQVGVGWTRIQRMSDILVEMGEELIILCRFLKAIDKNESALLEHSQHINELESEADDIYREVISDLFDGTHDVMEIIRWKEILETMETTADQAEKVSNVIKEVAMKYA